MGKFFYVVMGLTDNSRFSIQPQFPQIVAVPRFVGIGVVLGDSVFIFIDVFCFFGPTVFGEEPEKNECRTIKKEF